MREVSSLRSELSGLECKERSAREARRAAKRSRNHSAAKGFQKKAALIRKRIEAVEARLENLLSGEEPSEETHQGPDQHGGPLPLELQHPGIPPLRDRVDCRAPAVSAWKFRGRAILPLRGVHCPTCGRRAGGEFFVRASRSEVEARRRAFCDYCSWTDSKLVPLGEPKSEPSSRVRSSLPAGVRMQVLARDSYTCRYCGDTAVDGARLEVDHVHPASRGGDDSTENLVTSCLRCNRGKGARLLPLPPEFRQ